MVAWLHTLCVGRLCSPLYHSVCLARTFDGYKCTRIQEALLPIALEWESIDQDTSHFVLSDVKRIS
jgi:hypothetical protein